MLNRLYLCDVGGEETAAGRRVRTGLLYRSSALHKLRPDELARLRALAIRHIIDLREPALTARRPDRLPAEVITYLPFNMGRLESFKFHTALAQRKHWRQLAHTHLYAEVIEANTGLIQAFFDSLLDKPIPALFHCTVGKDRTGILASLFYLALGVPRARVIHSYLAIKPHLEKHLPAAFKWLCRGLKAPPLAYTVVPEYIENMLAHIETKYGGAEGYLGAINFVRLDALRNRFLDNDAKL